MVCEKVIDSIKKKGKKKMNIIEVRKSVLILNRAKGLFIEIIGLDQDLKATKASSGRCVEEYSGQRTAPAKT